MNFFCLFTPFVRRGDSHVLNRFSTLVLLSICISAASIGQSQKPLLDPTVQQILLENLSGDLARDHVYQITRHHRIQGSRDYRAAAQYVVSQLRSHGFSEQEAFVESFPSDGKRVYQTWQSPSGWDITSAELRMVEPFNERIVGYPEIAMSVITYSQTGDGTAELVWVGEGTRDTDYAGKDVRGKFVLATGYGGEVHRLAVLKYGARAVVCYLADSRAKEYPDMLQYTGMWPRSDELGRVTFGFNITNRQGERLRQLLEEGKKVVLHGRVSGIGLEPYFMDVVIARIVGSESPDEEIILSAHLDHPKESANDNASGSGAMLDIARTLKQLIATGVLSRPKRTIRFLWVPEWNGTMAYIDGHPEIVGPALKGKFLANLNMDMVGENLELVHSQMGITRPPDSTPSYLGDLIENMAEMTSALPVTSLRGSHSVMNYRITPYGGGSDHMMFIDRKIPGIMLGHSDYTHHTSEDTPDKVDPLELKRSELICGGAAWLMATMQENEAADLASLVSARALQRIGMVVRSYSQVMRVAPEDSVPKVWADAENALKHRSACERAGLRSIAQLNHGGEVTRQIETGVKEVNLIEESSVKAFLDLAGGHGARTEIPPPPEERPDLRVPERLTRGPLDFGLPESKLAPEDRAWYSSKDFTLDGNMRFELVNFIDGQTTVSGIRAELSGEFSPIATSEISHYVEDLVKAGVAKWK